jgi:hypothetical protein
MVTSMNGETLKLLRGDDGSPLVVKSKHYFNVNKYIPHPVMDFMIKGNPYIIRLTLLPGGLDAPAARKAGRAAL